MNNRPQHKERETIDPPAATDFSTGCCAETRSQTPTPDVTSATWVIGNVPTPAGDVPRLKTDLNLADRIGACKMRLGIGQMRYRVNPGLYAVGNPTPESPVLVSANYKLSLDHLRSHLTGLDAWIMVLDTNGVNVWCAAGKGTFGTDEIIRRLESTNLPDIVAHNTLIVPQLGAPGVAAHEVRKRSGFRVMYGPIRAKDIPAFLEAKMKATAEMRQVHFDLADRMAIIPVELFHWATYALIIAFCFFLLTGLCREGFRWTDVAHNGIVSAGLFLATYFGSCLFAPILLPWLPGRAFAMKGLFLGAILLLLLGSAVTKYPGCAENWISLMAWGFLVPTIASFITMNYTGTTTFTSLSGVRREMRVAVPFQLAGVATGFILWMIGRFV